MNTNQKPETPASSTKAPEPKAVPERVDTVSERAMRSCWMPIWQARNDQDFDPSKPVSF